MYCLRKTSPDGDINTSKLLRDMTLPDTVHEYLRHVQAVAWNRKFLVCRSLQGAPKWLFWLGSRYIRPGDLVCVLFRCSVPVILREKASSTYDFVGESYIHGKMDGEALATMDEDMISRSTVRFDLT